MDYFQYLFGNISNRPFLAKGGITTSFPFN